MRERERLGAVEIKTLSRIKHYWTRLFFISLKQRKNETATSCVYLRDSGTNYRPCLLSDGRWVMGGAWCAGAERGETRTDICGIASVHVLTQYFCRGSEYHRHI